MLQKDRVARRNETKRSSFVSPSSLLKLTHIFFISCGDPARDDVQSIDVPRIDSMSFTYVQFVELNSLRHACSIWTYSCPWSDLQRRRKLSLMTNRAASDTSQKRKYSQSIQRCWWKVNIVSIEIVNKVAFLVIPFSTDSIGIVRNQWNHCLPFRFPCVRKWECEEREMDEDVYTNAHTQSSDFLKMMKEWKM